MKETILITGAAQRIGLSCALDLTAQGFQVIATYRHEKPGLVELKNAGVICIPIDFSDKSSLPKLVDAVSNHTNQLRAIIYNASSWFPDNPWPEKVLTSASLEASLVTDAQLFDAMMQVHAKVPYQLTRALYPLLQAAAQADVIAMTDFVASVGSRTYTAYAASRAAMENLVFSFARQLAPHIKVNAIAPALIQFNSQDDEAYRQKALAKSLLGIEGGVAEVVSTVRYLLNSRFITGRVLALDGGRHLRLP